MDPYSTHLPALVTVCRAFMWFRKRCICVEFGAGQYSTPVIQALGGESYETNVGCQKEMTILYPNVRYVQDYHEVPKRFVDVCFIDCAPESIRADLALAWAPYAETIVLHDADEEWESAYRYQEKLVASGVWPKVLRFTGLKPHTLLLARDTAMQWRDILGAESA